MTGIWTHGGCTVAVHQWRIDHATLLWVARSNGVKHQILIARESSAEYKTPSMSWDCKPGTNSWDDQILLEKSELNDAAGF